MVTRSEPSAEQRSPLTKERVLRAAIDIADRGGIDALSMRKLGQELGVEAMSLYRHVGNKGEVLEGIVDLIVREIELSRGGAEWKAAMRGQVMAARTVMLRHPWAPRVLEERTSAGPAVLGYMESVLTILREGGFSLDLAHHALHVMGSRILGFNQDLFEDSDTSGPGPEEAAILARTMADSFPHITELAIAVRHDGGLGGCDDDVEFAFGLDLILDGLERLRGTSEVA